jgi:hypothetical protein
MVLTQTAEGVFVATEIRNGFPTLLSEQQVGKKIDLKNTM